LFCDNGTLITNRTLCWTSGTPTNVFAIEPEREEDCKAAFDYLNTIREENNRTSLIWDERLYQLAVFRSQDIYERNYFDHVTPEGKCVKDFQAQYNLSGYTIAENLGAVREGYGDSDMVYSKTIDVMDQVDGWMDSRGHRYNLLYPEHTLGAIGCYYGVCTFLGANTDPFGLGAGPCTTGAQGLSYWETVPIQPGEIN
jgi:uncharacterized protein YkwD